MIDFRKLMQDLKGEVIIIHLTNKLEETLHVQRIFKIISEKLKVYSRTVLILSGKFIVSLSAAILHVEVFAHKRHFYIESYFQTNNHISMLKNP